MNRVRGRRIAFLIASALPLLAVEEIAPPSNRTTPSPNVKSSTSTRIENDETDTPDQIRSAMGPLENLSDNTLQMPVPQTPLSLYSETVRWGSLDSLFSNDSILPFFPLDQEFEFAPFRSGASRYPPRDGTPNAAARKRDNASHKGKSLVAWNDGSASTSPQLKPPSDGTENVVDTVEIESPAMDDSKETASDDGNIKHVAVDFASKSAGAMILGSSANFKGSSNLLQTDRDKYAIVPCGEPSKYVVIGLSEDILVKEIVIANYERYSSHMKEFRILGSATTAVGSNNWIDLGTHVTAMSGSHAQTFRLSKPTWARYLKVEFLSHHGDEFYCTVSQISVHGSTVLQGFHEQWDEDHSSQGNNRTPDVSSENEDKTEASSGRSEATSDEVPQRNAEMEDKIPVVPSIEVEVSTSAPKADKAKVSLPNDTSRTLDRCIQNSRNVCSDGMNFTREMEEFVSGTSLAKLERPSVLALATMDRGLKRTRRSDSDGVHVASIPRPRAGCLVKYSSEESAIRTTGVVVGKLPIVKSSYVFEEINKRYPGLFVPDNIATRFHPSSQVSSVVEKDGKQPVVVAPTPSNEATKAEGESKGKMKPDIAARSDVAVAGTDEKVLETDGSRKVTQNEPTIRDDELEATGLALAKVLQRLPSAKCLESLNFSAFKSTSTKGRTGSGNSGSGGTGANMEPVFKKLTDEIRALQASVTAHDQFAQEAISCYQRVLLDMMLEMESDRLSQEARLSQIESDLRLGVLAVVAQQCITSLVLGVLAYLRVWFQACVALVNEMHSETKTVVLLLGGAVFSVSSYSFVSVMSRWRRRNSSFSTRRSLSALDMPSRDATFKLTD